MPRQLLVVALLFFPLLAYADPFGGMEVLFGVAIGVGIFVLLTLVFTFLAYFRPASKALQAMSWFGLVISLMLGVLWEAVFKGSSTMKLLSFNPFLGLTVPLAVWLGGATHALREQRPNWRVLWVVLAVFGANSLVGQLINSSLRGAGAQALLAGGGRWVLLAVGQVVVFGTWWLVLRQVQRLEPLGWADWQRAVLASGLVAMLGCVYGLADYWWIDGLGDVMAKLHIFGTTLLWAIPGWATGALAIWLNQRRQTVAVGE